MGVVGRNSCVNDIRSNVLRRDRDMGMNSKTTSRVGNQGLRDGKHTRSRDYDGYRIGGEESERASTVIRTSQLEPSAEMLVPVLEQKRAKGERGLGLNPTKRQSTDEGCRYSFSSVEFLTERFFSV